MARHPSTLFKFASFACHVVNFHLCKIFLEILVICYVFLQVLCLQCMLKDSETVQNACIEAASTKLLVWLCYLRFWKLVVDLTWIQSHLLCPKQQLLHGSDRHYFPWSCLELKCDTCFLYKAPSLLVCDRSAFTDPTCYETGEMGTVRLHAEKGSPRHLDNKRNWHSMMGHLSAMHQRCLNSRRRG